MNKLLQVIAEAHRFGNIIYHNRLETPAHNIERDNQYFKNRTPYVHKLGEAQNLLARIKGYQHFHELNANLSAIEDEQKEINKELKKNLLIAKNAIKTIPFVERSFEPIIKDKSFENIEETIPTSLFQRKQILKRKSQKDLLIGDIGSGIEHVLHDEAIKDITNDEPIVFITGTGSNLYVVEIISALSDEQNKNTYVLNFQSSKESKNNVTDSINPVDLWLLSKESFEKVFPPEISSWLYPGIMSFKEKGQQISLESLTDIVSLSTVISMAQSNEFNNQIQAKEYLKKLGLDINKIKEATIDDKEVEEALNQHIYALGNTIDVISSISTFLSTGQFCDIPTINLMHIFAKRKNLIVSLPNLDMSQKRHKILSHLINSLILGAESLNNNHYCQNIYSANNHMYLTEKQKNSPNKFMIGENTPHYLQASDLIGFDRVVVRKVFELPKAIEDAIFNNYFSSDFPEALEFISHHGKINVFDSNKNRIHKKYATFLIGLFSFSIHKNEPAYYFNYNYKSKQTNKKTHIKTTRHIGGKYE